MNNLIQNSTFDIDNQELIEIQKSKIKKLISEIDNYKIQINELNEKISSCDHLIIDYNSLNNNYIQMEKELYLLKNENNKLKLKIN